MKLCLDGNACDLPGFVCYENGKLSSSASSPVDAHVLRSLVENHDDPRCGATLARLEAHELVLTPDQRYFVAMRELSKTLPEESVWRMVGRHSKLVWVRRALRSFDERVDPRAVSYQRDVFVPCTTLFRSLRPFRIDPSFAHSGDPTANSFELNASGTIDPPCYNRFGTRTGRLTVASGAAVLTMRKASRQLLRSVGDDHTMVSLDFVALEARVALAVAGRSIDVEQDPYEFVRKKIGSKTRDEAKVATFSALYSDPTASGKSSDPRVAAVRRVFRLGETHAKLASEAGQTNVVRNLHGRRIEVAGHENLYSNYVQSIGVDVTSLGFLSILPGLLELDAKPHFLLHDALFLSVPRRHLDDLRRLGKRITVPKLDCEFSLAVETVDGSARVVDG